MKARMLCAVAGVFVLAACGGGGGSGGGMPPVPTFSLSSHSLTFSATGAYGATPAGQTLSGSVTNATGLTGTLYIVVKVSGSAVTSVSNFTVSGASGQATVSVAPPIQVGVGSFSSTLTVSACLNDATCTTGQLAGSPQTATVTYQVNEPSIKDAVLPHVIPAGSAGEVLIRGNGLTGTTAVAFGSVQATSFTVVDDSKITAKYPATLSPGTLTVTLTGSSSAFTGSVVAVGSQAYAAVSLNYPSAPGRIENLLFDAERQILYVAAAMSTPANNQLWAYSYSGGAWSSAQAVTIAGLADIALSADGKTLYALTSTSVIQYDATNVGGAALHTDTPSFIQVGIPHSPALLRLALSNDGFAMIETDSDAGVEADSYLYDAGTATFTDLGGSTQLLSYADGTASGLASSADGSLLIATQTRAHGTAPVAFTYNPDSEFATSFGVPLSQLIDQPASLDAHADRLAFFTQNYAYISDGSSNYLGELTLPPVGAMVRDVIVNPAGTRVFAVLSDNTLHTYDLTVAPSGSPLAFADSVAAASFAVPTVTQPTLRAVMTPDGATLFIAGDAGVRVLPPPG